jgi:hypothetical protein
MPASTAPTTPSKPGPALPRWAWALIALLIVVTIVSVTVAVFANSGREVIVLPPPNTGTQTAPASASTSASPTDGPTPTRAADGCLGGATNLDQAVLAAQQQSALTPTGAASFTATVVRWALSGPPSPYQGVTADKILTPDATSAARNALSSTKTVTDSSAASIDFTNGRYYIESADTSTAIISWVATARVTVSGSALAPATIAGTLHLKSINGQWRLRDFTRDRSIEDISNIGTTYAGGC